MTKFGDANGGHDASLLKTTKRLLITKIKDQAPPTHGASNNTSLSPKRAFLWCKLEFRISSGSGDIKFQVASNENLKMRRNRATLMPRKGASRRKTQNQSLGSALVMETMKTRNWGLPQFSRLIRQRGPLTSTKIETD